MVLSLDGRKEVNDRFRKDLAGNGSYDRIVPKFQKLVKARGDKDYYMRGTFTHYNTGLHQRSVPHGGRSGLYRAVHGAGGQRARQSRGPDARKICPILFRTSTSCWPRTCSAGKRRASPSPSTII